MTPPTELAVLMDGEHAGLLRRNRSGRLTLEYDADYEAETSSPPLSLSMPLRGGPYGHAAASRWISSLLPDHPRALERWYNREGVSTPFGLLASRIGYDCAGAVQFCRLDRLSELLDRSSGLTPLTPRRHGRARQGHGRGSGPVGHRRPRIVLQPGRIPEQAGAASDSDRVGSAPWIGSDHSHTEAAPQRRRPGGRWWSTSARRRRVGSAWTQSSPTSSFTGVIP